MGINAAMFVVEVGAGFQPQISIGGSRRARFLGDAAMYGISLVAWSGQLHYRAGAACRQRHEAWACSPVGDWYGGLARDTAHCRVPSRWALSALAALAANVASFGLLMGVPTAVMPT